MTVTRLEIVELAQELEHQRDLAACLPRPQPAFAVRGGAFCICGAGVPTGTWHGHGDGWAFMPAPPPVSDALLRASSVSLAGLVRSGLRRRGRG